MDKGDSMNLPMKIFVSVIGLLATFMLCLTLFGYGIPGYGMMQDYVGDTHKTSSPSIQTNGMKTIETGYGTQPFVIGTLHNATNKKYFYLQVSFDAISGGEKVGNCTQNFINVKPNSDMPIKALCAGATISGPKDVESINNPVIKGY
jgi:hypothetical protein